MHPDGPAPDHLELEVVVPQIAGPPVRAEGWVREAIFRPVASATAGIWRYQGDGWSAVLKLLHHSDVGSPMWRSGEHESHWFYWEREALAYESGLLDSLAGPLRAPRCFGVFRRTDGSIAIWLEDLAGTMPAGEWPIDRYGVAAEHLAIAQATWAESHGALDRPWLSRRWLREYVERRAPMMDELATDTLRHPMLRATIDADTARSIAALWDSREDLLSWVEEAPTTICHLDLHPKNLFAESGGTVLIDWAFVGLGALGEDAGNLIFDAVWDFHVAPAQFDELADAVTRGYLRGLAEAGQVHDVDAVRLAIVASGAVKYLWILPALMASTRTAQGEINNRPPAETIAAWAPAIPRIVEFGHRAGQLARALGR